MNEDKDYDILDAMTPAELHELQQFLSENAAVPGPEENFSAHRFIHEVATAKDTTKTGNLKEEELGVPINPARTFKSLALISRDILDNSFYAQHFMNESEILTSTSLAREAKLLELAVIQRRQLEDVTKKPMKENKGWFKSKDKQKSDS